jgi:general secretion pathway protein L
MPEIAAVRIDLRSHVTWESTKAAARAFGIWWLAEILALLPDEWRTRANAWLARPMMRLEGARWIVSWPQSAFESIVLDASLSDAAMRDELVRASKDRPIGSLAFMLSAREVMRRTVRLPMAAASRLRSAVELQLGRLSPFSGDEVVFDCASPVAASQSGEIDVDVAIVPSATLERHQAWLARLGLAASEFVVQGSDHRFRMAASGWHKDRLALSQAMGAAGLALWILAYFLAPSMREREIESEIAQMNALRASSLDAARAKDQLDQLRGPAAFLADKEQVTPPLDALEAVTLGFPNNARLIHLEIRGNQARARGVVTDTQSLMQVLTKSNRFADVRFAGATEKMADGRNRFVIDLTLRPGADIHEAARR